VNTISDMGGFPESGRPVLADQTGRVLMPFMRDGLFQLGSLPLPNGGVVDATGRILFDTLGAQQAPVISNTTSTNTGVFFPGGNQVAIVANGAASAQIHSGGIIASGVLTNQVGTSNASWTVQGLTELTTINAAASTTTAIQIPAASIVVGVSVRVTTAIPTATTFDVGDAGLATRFSTASVSTAANTTDPGTKAGAFYNATSTGVVLTMNGGTPANNTGRVRVTIHFISVSPPVI
jgi:hypothetical protein